MSRSEFLPRTIQADSQGLGSISVHGFGVEVLDGGVYGPENVLRLVRGEDGISQTFEDADIVPCVSGARVLGEFTGIQLESPRTSPVRDRVKLRILTSDGVRGVDAQPTGKPRVEWLARGSISVTNGEYGLVWASATNGEWDRFRADEQYQTRMNWFGWIASVRIFTVYVYANNAVNPASGGWYLTLLGTPQSLAPGPGTPPHTSGLVNYRFWDFTRVNVAYPFPPGSVEVYVQNGDVDAGTFEFIIGAKP